MNILFKKMIWLLLFILILPSLVFAQTPLERLKQVGTTEGPYGDATESTISTVLGMAVNAFLSILGVIFIGLMVYGGYMWMTARGEEEKANKAKDIIREAIIGLIIVIGAYAIWAFVFFYVINK